MFDQQTDRFDLVLDLFVAWLSLARLCGVLDTLLVYDTDRAVYIPTG